MNKTFFLFLLVAAIVTTSCKDDDSNPDEHIPGVIDVPGDHSTIQEAINDAENGDTILVAEGIYYENINLKGKAIIVASRFFTDGDKSHISKTIIDGSQPDNPDKASVVTMDTYEDTTSVLCGFTITGGNGSLFTNSGTQYLGGGGVNIIRSGGKIEYNIIEENHLTDPQSEPYSVLGAGINAIVSNNRTAIIRDNIIRNNTYFGTYLAGGGGMHIGGGRFIVEGNTVSGNILNAEEHAHGGGIFYARWLNVSQVIDEVIIRNNIITGNEMYGGISDIDLPITVYSHGAGMVIEGQFEDVVPLVYNNLIADNHAHDGMIGGVTAYDLPSVVFINNTIANNRAENGRYQMGLANTDPEYYPNVEAILLNNILWSEDENDSSGLWLVMEENLFPIVRYNNIRGGWEGEGNISVDPGFEGDSYSLSDSSLCIGRGVVSIEIEGTMYYAPSTDLHHNICPHASDNLVDLGAIESPYLSKKGN